MTEVPRKNRTRSTNALAIAGGFHRRLACLLLGALVGVGCNWQPPPAQSPAEATAVVPVARAEDPVTEAHIEMATPKHVQALEEPPVASEPVVPWPNDDLRERIVLLAPGGPIILDTWLTIAGRPHRDRFDEIVATALAAGDTNGDGRRTWTEWRDNTDFFAQSVPNQSPTSQQLDMWVETYDQNRDHRIQQSEIAAWLGRDAGRSAAPLSLRSQRSRDVGGNVESRLWALLDVDESGGLSDAEMAMAPDALWMLDADDDRILLDMELAPLEEQLAGNQARGVQRSRVAQRHAALHFGPQFDVGRLGYLLADMYAPRGTISRESFPGIPSLFEEIDDGDQWLGDDEFALGVDRPTSSPCDCLWRYSECGAKDYTRRNFATRCAAVPRGATFGVAHGISPGGLPIGAVRPRSGWCGGAVRGCSAEPNTGDGARRVRRAICVRRCK